MIIEKLQSKHVPQAVALQQQILPYAIDPEYAAKREELHALLVEVQNEYGDTDPCEKVRVLYKGDRRNFDRTDK